jgi:hypothetical protein
VGFQRRNGADWPWNGIGLREAVSVWLISKNIQPRAGPRTSTGTEAHRVTDVMATRQAVGDIRQGHVLAPCLCGLASWSRRAAVPLRCLSHLLPRRADSVVTSPSYLRRIASHSRLEVVGNTTGQRGYLTWIYPNKSLNSSLSRVPRRALANGRCARPYLTVPALSRLGALSTLYPLEVRCATILRDTRI